MRFLLPLTMLMFALVLQSASAQEPAAEIAVHLLDGWETVLPSGTLQPQPDIIAVDGGFALAASLFRGSGRALSTQPGCATIQYRATGQNTRFPQAERALLDLNEELLTLLDMSDLVPDDPRIKYQLIDAGRKLAFLIPSDDLNSDEGFGLYNDCSDCRSRREDFLSTLRLVLPGTPECGTRRLGFPGTRHVRDMQFDISP